MGPPGAWRNIAVETDRIGISRLRIRVAITPEQARILLRLAEVHRDTIVSRFSYGIWDGLVASLDWIGRDGPSLILPRAENPWLCPNCGAKTVIASTALCHPDPFVPHISQ